MDFRAGEGAGGEALQREPQGGAEASPDPERGQSPTEAQGEREGGTGGEEGAAGRAGAAGRWEGTAAEGL